MEPADNQRDQVLRGRLRLGHCGCTRCLTHACESHALMTNDECDCDMIKFYAGTAGWQNCALSECRMTQFDPWNNCSSLSLPSVAMLAQIILVYSVQKHRACQIFLSGAEAKSARPALLSRTAPWPYLNEMAMRMRRSLRRRRRRRRVIFWAPPQAHTYQDLHVEGKSSMRNGIGSTWRWSSSTSQNLSGMQSFNFPAL